jgi:hypothetical protein
VSADAHRALLLRVDKARAGPPEAIVCNDRVRESS